MKIKMKTMALVGLMGSALLLTGCGGGGSSSSSAPFDFTKGLNGQILPGFTQHDTDGNGVISREEGRAAWNAATEAEKGALLQSIGLERFPTETVDTILNGSKYAYTVVQDVALSNVNGVNGSGVKTLVIDGFSNGVTHGDKVKSIVDTIASGSDKYTIDVSTYGGGVDIEGAFINTDGSLNQNNVGKLVNANVTNISIASKILNGESVYRHDSNSVADGSLAIDTFFGNSNSLVVIAAGNDGLLCRSINTCNDVALESTGSATFGDKTIVVGAINDEGTDFHLSPNGKKYSNRAGLLKNDYIVAPVPFSAGTSFAAPVVSGVAALVMDNMNSTDAALVRTRILTTADDIGAPGVDDVFGHGRLNVGRALAPNGGLR